MRYSIKTYTKRGLKTLTSLLFILSFQVLAWMSVATNDTDHVSDAAHNTWLKQRFSEQHETLIPVVAVADMFFSCNQERKVDDRNYQLVELITVREKGALAEKLSLGLGEDKMQSDVARNFGLLGCFYYLFYFNLATTCKRFLYISHYF